MPRPVTPREIENLPTAIWFKPAGVPLRELDEVVLTFDEIEALRLADAEGLYQEEVAEKMKVSRATIGRILASAHKKTAEALVQGKAIRVEGGSISIRGTANGRPCCGRGRRHRGGHPDTEQPEQGGIKCQEETKQDPAAKAQ
jgi:predicted DNA-binding protein (UPF0251 family)